MLPQNFLPTPPMRLFSQAGDVVTRQHSILHQRQSIGHSPQFSRVQLWATVGITAARGDHERPALNPVRQLVRIHGGFLLGRRRLGHQLFEVRVVPRIFFQMVLHDMPPGLRAHRVFCLFAQAHGQLLGIVRVLLFKRNLLGAAQAVVPAAQPSAAALPGASAEALPGPPRAGPGWRADAAGTAREPCSDSRRSCWCRCRA